MRKIALSVCVTVLAFGFGMMAEHLAKPLAAIQGGMAADSDDWP